MPDLQPHSGTTVQVVDLYPNSGITVGVQASTLTLEPLYVCRASIPDLESMVFGGGQEGMNF